MFHALVRLGGASRDTLAVRTSLSSAETKLAIERLVTLGYAMATDDVGDTYRAVAQGGE